MKQQSEQTPEMELSIGVLQETHGKNSCIDSKEQTTKLKVKEMHFEYI